MSYVLDICCLQFHLTVCPQFINQTVGIRPYPSKTRRVEPAEMMKKSHVESGLNVCQGFGVNQRNHFGIINPVAALLTT